MALNFELWPWKLPRASSLNLITIHPIVVVLIMSFASFIQRAVGGRLLRLETITSSRLFRYGDLMIYSAPSVILLWTRFKPPIPFLWVNEKYITPLQSIQICSGCIFQQRVQLLDRSWPAGSDVSMALVRWYCGRYQPVEAGLAHWKRSLCCTSCWRCQVGVPGWALWTILLRRLYEPNR